LQDVAEDELALAAGVRGADQFVRRAEQALDGGELLAGALLFDELDPEVLGHNGERFQRPAPERRVVVLGLLEHGEVAQRPGHLVAPALEVTVVTGAGPEEGAEFAGDRRFLCEHDVHGASALVAARTSPGSASPGRGEPAWKRGGFLWPLWCIVHPAAARANPAGGGLTRAPAGGGGEIWGGPGAWPPGGVVACWPGVCRASAAPRFPPPAGP